MLPTSGAVVSTAMLLAALAATACQVQPEPDSEPPTRPRRGAVVAEHPLAVKVGLDVLDRGGNAADAAVATALALAVVLPEAGNLGGGGFALWVPHEGEASSFDFREVAPAGAEAELYLLPDGTVDSSRSLTTPLAVGVPGSPAGIEALLEEHGSGRFSLEQLVEPAVRLARIGFAVDPWLADNIVANESKLSADPGARAIFLPGGEPLREGQLLRQPELALALERLGELGSARGFYSGRVARAICATLEAARERTGVASAGPTLEDLVAYEVVQRPPLVGWFQGNEVISMGPPSSGGVVLLQVLSILEGMPLGAEQGAGGEPTVRALHWWIEALRRAFADRAEHLGDPDHHAVPVDELLDPSWVARRRISIGEQADPGVGPWQAAAPADASSETTHLSVLDSEGNAVSLTTTLNGNFGSGILVEEFGFLLNNELDDFSIQAGVPNMFGLVGSEANQLRPRRRPLSSMTPTVVRGSSGSVRLVLGAPGGPRIITAVFQVLIRVLQHGQDLEEAVAAPRLHQQWRPLETRFEGAFPRGIVEALARKHGQPVQAPGGAFASVQAIAVSASGDVVGVSDPRFGGVAGIQGAELPLPLRPDSSASERYR